MCLCERRERERDVDGSEEARESERDLIREMSLVEFVFEKVWRLHHSDYDFFYLLYNKLQLDFQLLVQWIQISNYW